MTLGELERRLAETRFVVDATHTEMQFVWERYSNQTLHITPGVSKYNFENMSPGVAITIGHIGFNMRPVVLSLSWWKVDGVVIMSHTIVSEVADHAMKDKWLKERCKPRWDHGTRLAYTDAMNFHNVIHFINDETKPK